MIDLTQGTSPLFISMPHVGTQIPAELQQSCTPLALQVEDTDWHLHQLYEFAPGLGASTLRSNISRYVIDLNRPPDDAPMYAGARNTELCPTRFFSGDDLYLPGTAPDAAERLRRRTIYWQPYHDALSTELERIKARHGYALLWDAHSIRSEIPWLFDGRLPDLNLGTASGESCVATLATRVADVAAGQARFSHVLNGRFKGGYITRHYGRPAQHIHAIQLEMCQSLYMQEVGPFAYAAALAVQVQPLLQSLLGAYMQAARELYG